MRHPAGLLHDPVAFTESTDVIVVGSGVAGLETALNLAEHFKVTIVTKSEIDAGSTSWAQGGIAAAIDIADSADQHFDDTIEAGAGLCAAAAVRVLVEEGPKELANLISRGANFDRNADGSISLGREGGHGRNRIAHAGGDATGAEVQRALHAELERHENITVFENTFALDLLKSSNGRVCGLVVSMFKNGIEKVGVVHAGAVVLASGGAGGIFQSTTNPRVATGDGLALALRAGASCADLEFVQFHPTVLFAGPEPFGQQVLISEAIRGEGAILVDPNGRAIMEGVHPRADLASRDVVAKTMVAAMRANKDHPLSHLYLDATMLGTKAWRGHFPNIYESCKNAGIDPAAEPIPVAPGAHFMCGGVRTDLNGRTDVAGLYAVGEVAHTGVHGANRLASNSLLEGLVFGPRVAAQIKFDGVTTVPVTPEESNEMQGLVDSSNRDSIRQAMSENVAVFRDRDSLDAAFACIRDGMSELDHNPTRDNWESTNIALVAEAVVRNATAREESRGCHQRLDFPETKPEYVHRVVSRMVDGEIVLTEYDIEEPQWAI